jgi:predicted CopG family antitoxin
MPKVVQLSAEAYDRFRMAKRPGESFSDVVLRLLPKGDLRELANLGLTPKQQREADEIRRAIQAVDREEARKWLRRFKRGRA